jgi:hypothetical protein
MAPLQAPGCAEQSSVLWADSPSGAGVRRVIFGFVGSSPLQGRGCAEQSSVLWADSPSGAVLSVPKWAGGAPSHWLTI